MICRTCKEDKDASLFSPKETRCKACNSKRATEYRLSNREKFLATKKKCYQKHLDENRNDALTRYYKNHERNKQRSLAYNRAHKEEIRVRDNAYRKARKANDPAYKLKSTLRIRINAALAGKTKSASTLEILGCTVDALKQHLQSKFTEGMHWNNHGTHGWHVDHVIPCASFDLSDHEQQRKCFHYTNLQPLWAADNIRKSDNLIYV